MDYIRVGDAVVGESSGLIYVIVEISNDKVYYKSSEDGFKEIRNQPLYAWRKDMTLRFKPILFTQAQEYLYAD